MKIILRDNVTDFTSNLFNAFALAFNIKVKHSTACNPQTNCIIERFHSTLANILKNFVSSTNKEWPDLLRSTLATYCMFTHNNDTEMSLLSDKDEHSPKIERKNCDKQKQEHNLTIAKRFCCNKLSFRQSSNMIFISANLSEYTDHFGANISDRERLPTDYYSVVLISVKAEVTHDCTC